MRTRRLSSCATTPSVAPQHLGEALLLLSASAYVVLVASILVPVALAGEAPYLFRPGVQRVWNGIRR